MITHRYQKMHLFNVDIQDDLTLKKSKQVIYYASVCKKDLHSDSFKTVKKEFSILISFKTPVSHLEMTIYFNLCFSEMSLALK